MGRTGHIKEAVLEQRPEESEIPEEVFRQRGKQMQRHKKKFCLIFSRTTQEATVAKTVREGCRCRSL